MSDAYGYEATTQGRGKMIKFNWNGNNIVLGDNFSGVDEYKLMLSVESYKNVFDEKIVPYANIVFLLHLEFIVKMGWDAITQGMTYDPEDPLCIPKKVIDSYLAYGDLGLKRYFGIFEALIASFLKPL